MEQHPDGSSSRSDLQSAEYRERLKRKLNCLIAVLEVASAKVRRSLASPEADVARLTRIKKNLQDTLDVCLRARTALEKRGALPPELSTDLARSVSPGLIEEAVARGREPVRSAGTGRQWASAAERRRLAGLDPIRGEMLRSVDLDLLARKLQG